MSLLTQTLMEDLTTYQSNHSSGDTDNSFASMEPKPHFASFSVTKQIFSDPVHLLDSFWERVEILQVINHYNDALY